ncbi:NAD(P)-binding protein [Cryphonectria parasitica EP155]|uniref:NAD(P)-binding protein n=1 Tax=Cryphonectria parasitica (strain ATCC 38755 / EP155) TaxID=660469 RepID=A0A9P4YBC7_CRYP1|nr:NAD(P)-binding protein [Cryphonectria parasitica EP155]KAF3769915.1 NAD(P)-binding protein [Cryphonectria parasitica EP155]
MSPKYNNVIVFGPTGEVGGAAALEASQRGASVWLAMRQTDKPIAALTTAQEQSGAFHRVQADLSDAASVKAAVQQSGAKTAFAYAMHGGPSMEPTFTAMKDAGIEHVVLLSSFTIHPDEALSDVPPARFIPYLHAQAELAIEKAGIAHTALRAGQFASNIFKNSLDRSKTPWEATLVSGKAAGDNISPADIGKVGGAVLVDPPVATGKHVIYVLGPQLSTDAEAVRVVERISGREVKVNTRTAAERAAEAKRAGRPEVICNYLQSFWENDEWWQKNGAPFAPLNYAEEAGNVKKYSGHEPETFEQYAARFLGV